jgi:2-amino-4-hydroxy-6-hydroxymethyldihydropteridine diphosphokinase|tara:strand:- start:17902 stop:18411 length:510 start_codon:yes stop_codon:yes gene_type:complete
MRSKKKIWKSCYIGLGSNLDDPLKQINLAIENIKKIPNSFYISSSKLYDSSPLGPSDQPNFINAVVAIVTQFEPHNLLNELQKIEHKQKRIRNELKWGPRTIDLDLLCMGQAVIQDDVLTLPHPEIQKRNFVLLPLIDISPDIMIPGLSNIVDLLKKIENNLIRVKCLD